MQPDDPDGSGGKWTMAIPAADLLPMSAKFVPVGIFLCKIDNSSEAANGCVGRNSVQIEIGNPVKYVPL